MTKLLLDGDILVYEAMASAEQEFEFVDGCYGRFTNMADAREHFSSAIASKAMDIPFVLVLSDPKVNWRKSIYPDYKGNRKDVKKPVGFYQFREWVSDTYNPVWKPTLEADDCLGILMTKPGADYILWSKDKDLKQIPGRHMVDGKVIQRSKEDGHYFHMMQTLMGDTTDGYPGCKGIGPKKAEELLEGCEYGTYWEKVVGAYEKAGLTEEFALCQARIAKILQWEDWNQTKQEVILWNP